jgi:hypothetical protein
VLSGAEYTLIAACGKLLCKFFHAGIIPNVLSHPSLDRWHGEGISKRNFGAGNPDYADDRIWPNSGGMKGQTVS